MFEILNSGKPEIARVMVVLTMIKCTLSILFNKLNYLSKLGRSYFKGAGKEGWQKMAARNKKDIVKKDGSN